MVIGDRVKPTDGIALEVASKTKGFIVPRMTTLERDAIPVKVIGMEIFNTDTGTKEFWDGIQFTAIGGGNSFFKVNQVGHGRTIGFAFIPVYIVGGVWTDAISNSQLTIASHVIVQIVDANNFIVASSGRYDVGVHGLVVDTHYFTSKTVAGAITPVEPDLFSNPVVFVESATVIHVTGFRGSTLSGFINNTVSSVFGRVGDVLPLAGDYTASQITNVPAGNIVAVEVQAALNELDAEKVNTDPTLTALAAFNTNGLMTQTAPDTFTGRTLVVGSTKVTIADGNGVAGNPTIDVDQTQIDHDLLTNFVANEHIDWTSATQNLLTTGSITGNSLTINTTATILGLVNGRNMVVDGVKLDGVEALADVTDTLNVTAAGAVMDADFAFAGIMTAVDGAGTYTQRVLTSGNALLSVVNGDGILGNPDFTVNESLIDHDNLTNFILDEHIPHSSVLIDVSAVNDGLSGGGDLTATRSLTVDINTLVLKPAALAGNEEIMIWDVGTNNLRKTTVTDLLAGVPVVGEGNTASNVGIGAGVFKTKVGVDLQFKSLTSGSTKLSITPNLDDVALDVVEANILITNLLGFDANRWIDHSAVNFNGVLGLTGGGDLTANRTMQLDITNLINETVIAATDTVAIFDVSAGAHREMTRADFLTGLASAPVDSVFGRIGAVVAVNGDYTASNITNVPAGSIAAVEVQAALNELDTEKEPNIVGGASTITSADLTINRALISSGTGKVIVSAVTNTELGFVGGVTSAIQTQINGKNRENMTQGGFCEVYSTLPTVPIANLTDIIIDFNVIEVTDALVCTYNAGLDEMTLTKAGRYKLSYCTTLDATGSTTIREGDMRIELSTGGPFALLPVTRTVGTFRTNRPVTVCRIISRVFGINDVIRSVGQVVTQATNSQYIDSVLTAEFMGI